MIGQIQQLKQAKSELENPHDSERIGALAEVLAEIERAQRAAVIDQRVALGIDPDDTGRIDPDERRDELIDLVDAYTPGGPSLAKIWLKRSPPEKLDADDPTDLAHYAEMDPDEWEAQIQSWAETYRTQANGTLTESDRELADHHVRGQWGLSLDEFEATIVEFDRRRALRDLLAGPSEGTEEAIRSNTEVLA